MTKVQKIIYGDSKLFAAFQIGRHSFWRDEWMQQARKAKCESNRAMLVRWARSDNHVLISYLKGL